MRENGMSIRDISQELKINKSTVSYWCRNIELSERQRKNLILKQRKAGLRALLLATEKKKIHRTKETKILKKEGEEMVGKLSPRDLFCVGLGLYCGEGYKSGNEEVGFTNSDVRIIRFMKKWFEKIYGIKKEDFIFRVSLNISHKKREKEVMKFWIDSLNVFENQFSKTSFIKTEKKKIYKDGKKYYGTLRMKVRKGTKLRRKIMGSVGEVLSS